MPLSEKSLQTWLTLMRTHAKVQEKLADQMVCQHEIPLTWYDVLVHLYRAPGQALRMQDLADAVILSSSGLTRLLDRMIEANLVHRVACEEDRRVIFATLTPTGLALIEEILPHHQERVERYFGQYLSDEEITVIQTALQRVLQSITARGEEDDVPYADAMQ